MFNTGISKVEQLKKKSANAIGVFKKVTSDLASTNQEINQERTAKKKQIEALQKEDKELETQHQENSAIITKVNEFLGVNDK